METQTTKMSSKGQVVIPQKIRDEIGIEEGSLFIVIANNDSVILKKIKTPSKEEIIKNIKKIASVNEKNAEKIGIKEKNVNDIIHKIRQNK